MSNLNNSDHHQNEFESSNIKTKILKYLGYWYIFAAGVFICLIIAFFYIRYNTIPQYHISSTILIKDDNSSKNIASGLSSTVGNLSTNKSLSNEIVILKSKSLMLRVLSELSLNVGYFMEGKIREVEIYKDNLPITLIISRLDSTSYGKTIKIKNLDNNNFQLLETDNFGEIIKTSHKFGKEISKSYGTFTVISTSNQDVSNEIIIRFNNIKKLAEGFSNNLFISLVDKDANVLRLNLIDPIPQRSIAILNKLVEVYNKEWIKDKNQIDASTISFLDDRIHFLSGEISDVEKNVEQFKQKNNLTDVSSNAQIYLQRASDYNKQLADFEMQVDILNSLENYVKQEKLKLVPSSLNIQDPTLNGLIAKFNELQLEKERMLRTIQSSSSLILNIDDQLSNLRMTILENLSNIKNGLIITQNNLKSNSNQFQYRIQRVPSIERELLEINRQQGIKQEIYLYLLQRREEAGLSLASTSPNSRIIDSATAGDFPISPNKFSIYFTSSLIGIFLPIAFIFIKDILYTKITDRQEVGKLTKMPILGEIYESKNNLTLQIWEGNNSAIAESFRLIRSNLHFATLGNENKVILVTSSISGEGKTFFSINLSACLALSGKRVLILGFDLRNPQLFSALEVQDKIGISDLLISNNLTPDELVIPIKKIPGLFAIGAGTIPTNPSELIMSPKVEKFIDNLKDQFDYIVIDSSPLGPVADTFNLSSYVDSTIFIVRYNYTDKNNLELIEDFYRNKKLTNPMLVLNDAKLKGSDYGYYQKNQILKNKTKPSLSEHEKNPIPLNSA